MAKRTETRDELSTTCNPMSRCLSAPDATPLTSLPQEQAAKTNIMVSVVRIQVFSIMHS